MTITANAVPFDLFKIDTEQVILRDFTGESIDDATLVYKRSAAKPTATFVGMEKGEVKMSVFDSAGKLAGIYALNTSIRADQTEAARAGHMTTLGALCTHAATLALVKEQRLPLSGS